MRRARKSTASRCARMIPTAFRRTTTWSTTARSSRRHSSAWPHFDPTNSPSSTTTHLAISALRPSSSTISSSSPSTTRVPMAATCTTSAPHSAPRPPRMTCEAAPRRPSRRRTSATTRFPFSRQRRSRRQRRRSVQPRSGPLPLPRCLLKPQRRRPLRGRRRRQRHRVRRRRQRHRVRRRRPQRPWRQRPRQPRSPLWPAAVRTARKVAVASTRAPSRASSWLASSPSFAVS
mmetsp:Transcript_5428/g.16419  ORF Transcript_5428/g.16419 Transcript_5428/m.16419 type:complete len:232 (+) Transcript_5428:440-1135(+)